VDLERQRHAQLRRDALRAHVLRVDDRHEVVRADPLQRVVARDGRRLRRVARTPRLACQPPAQLGSRHEIGEQRRREGEPGEAHEPALQRAAVGDLHGPGAEAVLLPVVMDEAVEAANRGLVDRPVEVPRHFRVAVHGDHRGLVLRAPAAQQQPLGAQFGRHPATLSPDTRGAPRVARNA
jgi:hypothetical protein